MIELGDEVKNRINGFRGIVTGKCEYLAGCNSILVTPRKLDKDGIPQEGKWIDEDYLQIIKKQVFKSSIELAKEKSNPLKSYTGGERDDFPEPR